MGKQFTFSLICLLTLCAAWQPGVAAQYADGQDKSKPAAQQDKSQQPVVDVVFGGRERPPPSQCFQDLQNSVPRAVQKRLVQSWLMGFAGIASMSLVRRNSATCSLIRLMARAASRRHWATSYSICAAGGCGLLGETRGM